MKRILWLLIWCATILSPSSGFVKKKEWEKVKFYDGVQSCNLPQVHFREEEMAATRKVTGPLLPKRFQTRLAMTAPKHDWAPFKRTSEMVFIGNAVFFFDSCITWDETDKSKCVEALPDGEQRVFGVHFDKMVDEAFSTDYSRNGDTKCAYSMEGAPPVPSDDPDYFSSKCFIFRLFQKSYQERRDLVSFDSRNPSQLVASFNSRFIAWIDHVKDATSIRVVDLIHRHALSDDLLNSYEVIDRTGTTEADSGPMSNHVSRSHPVFCGEEFLLYQVKNGNSTAIVLRDLFSPSLAVETVGTQSFFPVAATVTTELREKSNGLHICTAAWIESTTWTLTIFQLPRREAVPVPKKLWVDGSFDTLYDLTLAGDYLFMILFSEQEQAYKIRFSYIGSATGFVNTNESPFQDVENSTSRRPIKFMESNSDSIVLYMKQGEREDGRDNQLRLVNVETEGKEVHCMVESVLLREEYGSSETLNVLDASIYKDSVLWIADVEGKDHQVLEMLDLDKDNDGMLDLLDEFPFNFYFREDLDEDGIADEMDFIHFAGEMNDDHVMYLIFAGFYVTIIIGTIATIKYYDYLLTKRQHELQQTQDLDDSDGKTRSTMTFGSFLLKRKKGIDGSDKNGVERYPSLRNRGQVTPLGVIPGGSQKILHSGKSNLKALPTNCEEGIRRRDNRDLSKRSIYDGPIKRIEVLHTVTEVLLTALTVSSLILAVYPSYPYGGAPPQVQRICIWADFFSSSMFLVDLFARLFTRNIKEVPTKRQFFKDNWYDIPALMTDIPLTAIQFPDLLGLFKGFRIIRLYRRFTQQAVFVSLMVKRPMLYLATVVSLIIIVCTVFIKILEQDEQEEFRDFRNVLWFSMVTVTTVGYGDYQVKKPTTWVVTFFLMILGIGLISTISAFCAEKIVSIGMAEEKKREMKIDLRNQADMLKVGLMHIAEPYNPLSTAVENIMNQRRAKTHRISQHGLMFNHKRNSFTLEDADDDSKPQEGNNLSWVERNFQAINKHRSSALNVTVGMKSEFTLPIERILEGAGGKFRISAISSQADLIRAVAKEYEQAMLLQVLRLQKRTSHQANQGRSEKSLQMVNGMSNLSFSPKTRLHFVLLRFSLHRVERGGVSNFTEMADELADIIFEPSRPLGLFLEKIFAIDKELKQYKESKPSLAASLSTSSTNQNASADESKEEAVPPFYSYDFQDPIQDKLIRIDEHFERYGINQRTDYNEIVTEITILLLLHDRVSCVEWSLKNLQYQKGKLKPKPVFEEMQPPPAELPSMNTVIMNPSRETSRESHSSPENSDGDKNWRHANTRVRAGKRMSSISRTKSRYRVASSVSSQAE